MADRTANPFPGLRRPGLPPELRGRVLEAAARVAAPAPTAVDWVDRLWQSRAGRWSLAATLAALLAGHLAVSRWPSPWDRTGLGSPPPWSAEMSMVGALDEWPALQRLLEGGGGWRR
ncbi:MAG TPA: hypothetical protein VMV46_17300 [Thermoanaerobaculia bacterium]|nr:hypothetical protein [Thermoanaerobaculia bacterium]